MGHSRDAWVYILGHSNFIKEGEYSIDPRIEDEEGNAIFINSTEFTNSNENFHYYGCHLSGVPGGEITVREAFGYLKNDLKEITECPKVRSCLPQVIYVASTQFNEHMPKDGVFELQQKLEEEYRQKNRFCPAAI